MQFDKGNFRVLRHRDFRLLLAGQSASNLGTNVVTVAMALYITRSTGSATDLGVILAAQSAPFVLLLLFGGVWADRLPRHELMIATDVIRAALHGLLAALIFLGSPAVWLIALIEAVYGAAQAFYQPAYTGLLPQTVDEHEIQAARALTEGSWNLSILLGPAIATAVVLTVGAGETFALDAATFLFSAVLLIPVRPRSRGVETSPEARRASSAFSELRQGFHEVASRSWVWVTILAYTVTMMTFFATWTSLGPSAIRNVYGSVGTYGVLEAILGVGSVVGSLLGTVWHPRRPLRNCLILGILWPGIALVAALGAPLPFLIVWMFVAGINGALFMVAWESALAHHVPPEALSRVSAYDWMGSLALLPVGYALAGPLAGEFGTRVVLGVGGAVGMLAVALALIPRSTRELGPGPVTADQPPPGHPPLSRI